MSASCCVDLRVAGQCSSGMGPTQVRGSTNADFNFSRTGHISSLGIYRELKIQLAEVWKSVPYMCTCW